MEEINAKMTLPTAVQMSHLYNRGDVNFNFMLDGYQMATGYNCEGSVAGWNYDKNDESRGLMPFGEVFLKDAYDQDNLQTFGEKDAHNQHISNRWAFAGAGIMPRIEKPEDLAMDTIKIGGQEYLTIGGNIVTCPRRKVTTQALIDELDAMRASGEMQEVGEYPMSNNSQVGSSMAGKPVAMNKVYLHPRNGREYVYVDNVTDPRGRGWCLREPLHATKDQGELQITDIMCQTYVEDLNTFKSRGAQKGEILDLDNTHLAQMMNEYLLPEMILDAERNQELTQKLIHEAGMAQQQAAQQQIDGGMSR